MQKTNDNSLGVYVIKFLEFVDGKYKNKVFHVPGCF